MSCIPCFLTKAIPVCIKEVTVGTAEASTDYDLYITNANTGYAIRQRITSDIDGLIIAYVEAIEFSANHKYEIKVTEPGDSIDKTIIIKVVGQSEESEIKCITVPFFRVFSTEEAQESAVLEIDLTCECA